MKKPKGKMHLLDVSENLQCFSGIICRCGTMIHKGVPIFFANVDFINPDRVLQAEEGIQMLSKCLPCWWNPPERTEDKRQYVYVIMERSGEHVEDEALELVEAA